MIHRLFLVAAYDTRGKINKSLKYYIRALAKCGDIILVMDADPDKSSDKALRGIPNILHAIFQRHGEYDFGSYKRAYDYAASARILKDYDWVYFVNDSVFGPLNNLNEILCDLESRDTPFIGISSNSDTATPEHVQSWFMGLRRDVVTKKFVAQFFKSIKKEKTKKAIVKKYEIGFSKLMTRNGYAFKTIFCQNSAKSNIMYRRPYDAIRHGVPFIKKSSIKHALSEKYLAQVVRNKTLMSAIREYIRDNDIKFKRHPFVKLKLGIFGGFHSYIK